MTDEKKKPDEDEVTEEQLEDVTGGATAPTTQPITGTKPQDIASARIADLVCDGKMPLVDPLDVTEITDDED